jgi:hypothetical protein
MVRSKINIRAAENGFELIRGFVEKSTFSQEVKIKLVYAIDTAEYVYLTRKDVDEIGLMVKLIEQELHSIAPEKRRVIQRLLKFYKGVYRGTPRIRYYNSYRAKTMKRPKPTTGMSLGEFFRRKVEGYKNN